MQKRIDIYLTTGDITEKLLEKLDEDLAVFVKRLEEAGTPLNDQSRHALGEFVAKVMTVAAQEGAREQARTINRGFERTGQATRIHYDPDPL